MGGPKPLVLQIDLIRIRYSIFQIDPIRIRYSIFQIDPIRIRYSIFQIDSIRKRYSIFGMPDDILINLVKSSIKRLLSPVLVQSFPH